MIQCCRRWRTDIWPTRDWHSVKRTPPLLTAKARWLAPDDAQSYMCRAGLYDAVGQSERAREDARTALKLLDPADKANWGFWEYNFRIDAFSILGQPQQAADEALALFKAEGLRD